MSVLRLYQSRSMNIVAETLSKPHLPVESPILISGFSLPIEGATTSPFRLNNYKNAFNCLFLFFFFLQIQCRPYLNKGTRESLTEGPVTLLNSMDMVCAAIDSITSGLTLLLSKAESRMSTLPLLNKIFCMRIYYVRHKFLLYYLVSNVVLVGLEAIVIIKGGNKMLNCILKLEDCRAPDVTAAWTARWPI